MSHVCETNYFMGIDTVVFLDPYPKSLVNEMHSDAVCIEGADRGDYTKFPAVKFEHFYRITPRRYREFFERGSRKNDSGDFKEYIDSRKVPFVDIKHPYYGALESEIEELAVAAGIDAGIFENMPDDPLHS